MENIRDSLCGKTSQGLSVAIMERTLEPCLKKSDKPKFQCLLAANGQPQEWQNFKSVKSHGAYSTLSIGEYPSAAVESSLSRILQMGGVPEKYYLSSRACQGILRRAERRGKELPPELKTALEAQVTVYKAQ